MNTNDLLEVGVGMGLNASLGNSKAGKYVKVISRQGCSRKFDPTIGDLTEWLLTKCYFDLITQNSIEFTSGDCNEFTSLEDSLKENLLNIALQIIREEKEE